jgi:hypothetical protein
MSVKVDMMRTFVLTPYSQVRSHSRDAARRRCREQHADANSRLAWDIEASGP